MCAAAGQECRLPLAASESFKAEILCREFDEKVEQRNEPEAFRWKEASST